MYKVGDKVVCVNAHPRLTNHKTYKIISHVRSVIFVIDDASQYQGFDETRFQSVIELRKQKLKKICSKLEIK